MYVEIFKRIPKKIIIEANRLGGIDVDNSETVRELPYFDKGGHRERSIANQRNHIKHWKKVEHRREVRHS